jgi:ATP-dependent exoDNAse (exonuclease V) alpha subunit
LRRRRVDVKAFMERFFAEAINQRDIFLLDEFCALDYKWHGAENSEALGEAT